MADSRGAVPAQGWTTSNDPCDIHLGEERVIYIYPAQVNCQAQLREHRLIFFGSVPATATL